MKIETTPRDDHQVKVVVELEPEILEHKMKKAARHISEHTRIPGFRPGKAPYDMVLRSVGEERVREEAIELVTEEVYPQVLKEKNIEPGAMGSLDDIVSMDPLTLSFIVPLAPQVELGDYTSVRLPYEYKGVEEDEVEKVVEQYRSYYATLEPVEGAAKIGDVVFIKLEGKSGDEVIIPERPLQIKIDAKDEINENEFPFKGFSQKLIGAKDEKELSLSYDYPADFQDEKLKGKKVEYTVKVQSVKKMILPEVDETFIKNFGSFETVDDFKKTIRTQLEENKQAEYDFDYYNRVIELIKEKATIKYPPQVLDDEKAELLKSFERDLAERHMDMEAYLKMVQKTHQEFEESELVPQAKNKLERTLIMSEVSKAEKIELSDKEIEESYHDTLHDIASTTQDFDKLVKKMPKEKLVNAIAMEAASRVMNRRTYEALKRIATGGSTEEPAEKTEAKTESKAKPRKPKAKTVKEEAPKEEAES